MRGLPARGGGGGSSKQRRREIYTASVPDIRPRQGGRHTSMHPRDINPVALYPLPCNQLSQEMIVRQLERRNGGRVAIHRGLAVPSVLHTPHTPSQPHLLRPLSPPFPTPSPSSPRQQQGERPPKEEEEKEEPTRPVAPKHASLASSMTTLSPVPSPSPFTSPLSSPPPSPSPFTSSLSSWAARLRHYRL